MAELQWISMERSTWPKRHGWRKAAHMRRISSYQWNYGWKVAQVEVIKTDGMEWELVDRGGLVGTICPAPGNIKLF